MDFASAIIKIVIIDLVLSGDNAVVIGMAARRLEARQRKLAIVIGGGAAIVLRIVLTIVAALLMKLNGLRAAGGLLLIWIGFKLLKDEEEAEGVKVAHTMREAIITILIADFVMSLDNVLGVAAASAGNLWLLGFGLAFSMVILMFMGSLVATLINRFAWLAYAGAAVIVWTGATLIFEDPLLSDRVRLAEIAKYGIAAAVTMGTLVFAHWFHRVRNE